MFSYKTNPDGYLRHHKDETGRLRMEHDLIWERAYGAIPEGHEIHHIDGNKTNNDLSNLQLVTPLEHKRLHEGCRLIDGVWYKPCKVCGEYKPATEEHWYFSRGWINGRVCRPCYVKKVVNERRDRVSRGWKRKEYRKECST